MIHLYFIPVIICFTFMLLSHPTLLRSHRFFHSILLIFDTNHQALNWKTKNFKLILCWLKHFLNLNVDQIFIAKTMTTNMV